VSKVFVGDARCDGTESGDVTRAGEREDGISKGEIKQSQLPTSTRHR